MSLSPKTLALLQEVYLLFNLVNDDLNLEDLNMDEEEDQKILDAVLKNMISKKWIGKTSANHTTLLKLKPAGEKRIAELKKTVKSLVKLFKDKDVDRSLASRKKAVMEVMKKKQLTLLPCLLVRLFDRNYPDQGCSSISWFMNNMVADIISGLKLTRAWDKKKECYAHLTVDSLTSETFDKDILAILLTSKFWYFNGYSNPEHDRPYHYSITVYPEDWTDLGFAPDDVIDFGFSGKFITQLCKILPLGLAAWFSNRAYENKSCQFLDVSSVPCKNDTQEVMLKLVSRGMVLEVPRIEPHECEELQNQFDPPVAKEFHHFDPDSFAQYIMNKNDIKGILNNAVYGGPLKEVPFFNEAYSQETNIHYLFDCIQGRVKSAHLLDVNPITIHPPKLYPKN